MRLPGRAENRRLGLLALVAVTLTLVQVLRLVAIVPPDDNAARPGPGAVAGLAAGEVAGESECGGSGQHELHITCDYTEAPHAPADPRTAHRIVLEHSVLSLRTDDENHMYVELTFLNAGPASLAEAYSVYLAIDDESGNNYVRRPLRTVDLDKIEPGKRVTFIERPLIGVLRPGRYFIHLWIPSPQVSLKHNTAHNFLLGSRGVPDARTGLNRIAKFTLEP